ncbi:MAG: UDP-N-acetylmuramate dehydrogenase [Ignavibacteriaceae bacterium]|nr:UDP-N-acetylmuramate dehydrogenase [Ignavibacteriaceae bacterium]
MLHYLKKSLKDYNSFQLDVTADELIILSEVNEVISEVKRLTAHKRNFVILGGGSNVLFSADYNGTVLINRLKGVSVITEPDGDFLITVSSGEDWDAFVQTAVENGWYGLENLSLIPGTVGASPIQNIGAYGQEAGNFIHSVTYLDLLSKEIITLNKESCRFGYRNSIFKQELKGRFFIISVTFRLQKRFTPVLNYADLANRFKRKETSDISAQEVRNSVIEIRRSKLPDPKEIGNAGSFFKNPEIRLSEFNVLKEKFPEIPGFIKGDWVKVPAGWLIQETGWRGKRYKNTGTYQKQALVLINYGSAAPEELIELKNLIKKDVLDKFSLELEEEVNIIEPDFG